MSENNKVEYLVVDTSAFINNAALQNIGTIIVTEQDVINEVNSKRQLRRLVVLPYEMKVQNAAPEDIKFVTEFSKKTGDYSSLSATDIKVIALTYQLEKEKVGSKHLKTQPSVVKTIATSTNKNKIHAKPSIGFYMPKKKTNSKSIKDAINCNASVQSNTTAINDANEQEELKPITNESSDETSSYYEDALSNVSEDSIEDLAHTFSDFACDSSKLDIENENDNDNVEDILLPISTNTNTDNEEHINATEHAEECDDSDDNGWITPKNFISVRKRINTNIIEKKPAVVACLTTDFAMQNVLMQIGLNVAALDGKVIKQMRTYIFRCYACFKTTSIMTKVFCPNCGNKTLKKVAVSLNDDGKQQIHINLRKPLSAKGKRFSLPKAQGGKHSNNPILCEDQPMPHQRPSRLARTKNDPLQDDWIAGYSPFAIRDVNSKSAMLKIRPNTTIKYWMRKNPNESKRLSK